MNQPVETSGCELVRGTFLDSKKAAPRASMPRDRESGKSGKGAAEA
eukprot:CAMPEP_0203960166 /NCGR_PEP_ID=MMETSP0359-20131031/90946_1 /ASSEMBLY_ACC=CAM_ASM_000338 /TAXON_ID=268821 /ORGANISM="Scrippsiella Hangoei, Strain SHTV-5" /LENGTH=45 /DNA_ID= /DNA_START= /DNA_END= /DNA_ORIENTATION=